MATMVPSLAPCYLCAYRHVTQMFSHFPPLSIHIRVETQRIQWKKLPRTLAEGDTEVVTPNRRLNDERLKRLQSIGFAWSAKNVRKPKPASPEEPMVARARKSNIPTDPVSRAAARQQENDRQWMYMYDRLVEYKNKHGVSNTRGIVMLMLETRLLVAHTKHCFFFSIGLSRAKKVSRRPQARKLGRGTA
jgi:hypothetical protein